MVGVEGVAGVGAGAVGVGFAGIEGEGLPLEELAGVVEVGKYGIKFGKSEPALPRTPERRT
jgi:hypothetical protein